MDYNGRRLRHEQKYYISYGEYYNLVSKLSAVLKRDGNYGDKGYFIRSLYFDDMYKKPIPKFPKRIGIITAPTGAAIRDIITTINRRYKLVELYIFPSLVQGENAKDDIVKNLERADNYDLDLIILGRGGGSIEDLWAFNEEVVADAIFKSNTPEIKRYKNDIIAKCLMDILTSGRSSSTIRKKHTSRRILRRIRSGTALRLICLKMVLICAPFSRCLDTATFPPRRSIRSWSSRI